MNPKIKIPTILKIVENGSKMLGANFRILENFFFFVKFVKGNFLKECFVMKIYLWKKFPQKVNLKISQKKYPLKNLPPKKSHKKKKIIEFFLKFC